MIKPVYAVRDVKTTFLSPFVDLNDDSAVRGFAYSISERPDIIGFSPKDFALYRIGSFDDRSGSLLPEPLPILVCEAVDVIGGCDA